MRTTFLLLIAAILISLSSCRNDFEFERSTGGLEFSADTIYLDTVFTNIGSSTYTLKVYNRSDKDISIPTIQLANGLDSKYRMTVDGMQGNNGKIFTNVEMLARDSLFIFIETTANITDANPTDFLYTDKIQFNSGTNLQSVELVTLIQDAIFLYPQRFDNGQYESIPVGIDNQGMPVEAYGFFLEGDELHWTNEKPYVIYGYAAVPSNATLIVDPGVRAHFHDSSGIIAFNNATVNINGTDSTTPDLENEVIFEGDRLEPFFADVPGQWDFIYMSPGSRGTFTNLTIKNAIVGIVASGNDGTDYTLNLKNVQIYDSSNLGIYATTGHIKGENVVINNAGVAAFAGLYGGKYNFTHSTFNNNWPSSTQVSVLLSNFFDGAVPVAMDLQEATFNNCIIYGSNGTQFQLDENNDAAFNFLFNHCLLKFNPSNNLLVNDVNYNFDGPHYNNCYIATNSQVFNPRFWSVNNNQLNITEESDAIGLGDPAFIFNDILNTVRQNPPDLGAYQNAINPDEN